ncbi:MAG: choice-of-anchor tandem repeat GloVer-containing protein [Bryobacteraceae bacterium]|jgi:uncharacterized repeat protein (TIGR03803 family)
MKGIQLHAVALVLGALLSAWHAAGETQFATLYEFPSGDAPAGLTAAGGVLYGVGEGPGCGAVFEMLPPGQDGGEWTQTVLYAFTGDSGDACGPNGLTAAPTGALFGMSTGGGASLFGAVFELRPPAMAGGTWTETVLCSFSGGSDGGDPFGNVVVGPDGALYGATTEGGAHGYGNVFKLQPPATPGGAWAYTPLYGFAGGSDAAIPVSLTMGLHGVLYGTSEMGGSSKFSAGTIFRLEPPAGPDGDWTETVLYSFQSDEDGSSPYSPVAAAKDGSIFGTTFGTLFVGSYPGPKGVGSVLRLTPPSSAGGTWTKTILQQFGEGNDCGPDSPLTLRDGTIYGMTCLGAGGPVFELQPPAATGGAWTTTVLHQFTNGQQPNGSFVMNESGAIFGSTFGVHQVPGTVYEVAP